MKNYRIVTDAFSGYEAQVRYTFLPFVWFQLNDHSGVNTWNTPQQAMEFIQQIKAGTYVKIKSNQSNIWGDCQKEVKSLLSANKFTPNREVIWQQSLMPEVNSRRFQPAY
jgi:hypothetical protein